MQRKVDHEIALLRSQGIPASAQELSTLAAVPAGTPDATPAWRKPIKALSNRAIGRHPYGFSVLDNHGDWPPLPGEEWPKLAQAEKYLSTHRALFDAIDAAVVAPGVCCFIEDYSEGGEISLQHAQELRMISRLLVLRAFVHAHQGNSDAVLQDLNAMLAASEALSREPDMVSQLVRSRIARLGLLTVEKLLPLLDPSDDHLAKLQQRLEALSFHHGLELSVIGLRVLGLTSFENPSTAGAGATPTPFYRMWVRDHPLDLLEATKKIQRVVSEPWPAPLVIAIPRTRDTWQNAHSSAPWGTQTWHAPTKFAETVQSTIITAAEDDARARAAAIGVAAMRFQRQLQRWPKTIEELIPNYLGELPLDPFTGEPLKYAIDSSSLKVYSVGQDLQDDGGSELLDKQEHGTYISGKPDVVFSLEIKKLP